MRTFLVDRVEESGTRPSGTPVIAVTESVRMRCQYCGEEVLVTTTFDDGTVIFDHGTSYCEAHDVFCDMTPTEFMNSIWRMHLFEFKD
jgi:hypothetical protein